MNIIKKIRSKLFNIFDRDQINKIILQSLNLPEEERLNYILSELKKIYPHISLKNNFHLTIINGFPGIISIIDCSLTEYLILYGTIKGATGTSGSYLHNIRDFVFQGKITYHEKLNNKIESKIAKPGEFINLKPLSVNQYTTDDNSWVIEHGNGILIPAFIIMFVSSFSLGDWITPWKLSLNYLEKFINRILYY